MDANLALPRELTEKEETDLRKLLNLQLHITTLLADEEDAEVLLDYAFDMIKGGDNIGQVVEELVLMEFPVCGEEEGEKIGSVLTDFYNQMRTLEEAAAKQARAKELEVTIVAHAEEEALATEAVRAEEDCIATEIAAKEVEEDRISAALEAKNKEKEERIDLGLEAEKRDEDEAKEEDAVDDVASTVGDITTNNEDEEAAADASPVVAEDAAAAKSIQCASEEADFFAETSRADEEAATAAAQRKAELEARLARLENLAEEKKDEEESAAITEERVDEKEATLTFEQKANEEEMLVAAKANRKSEEEAALAAIEKAQEEAWVAAARSIAQEKKAATQAASGSKTPSVDTSVVHAPMSRELADIRRGELEKIKQARSEMHNYLRDHWEDRVKSNDQTHVSLVAAARAKIEKGALLTRYLELQKNSRMIGFVVEDDAMHEDFHQQVREEGPQEQIPATTHCQKRNSRETAQQFDQEIKLHDKTHAFASTYDEKDKYDVEQQLHSNFEGDRQSADDAVEECIKSFLPTTDKSTNHTTDKDMSKTSLRGTSPGEVNKASNVPDVCLYGDAANVKGTFNANQERGDVFIPMPVQTSTQKAIKQLQTRDESHASPPAPDVSMYGDAANVKSTFNANQERGDVFIPMPVQTSTQKAIKQLQTRDESHASPPAPDVSMYGDAANVKSTFNANQERGDAFIPMPVQTSTQKAIKQLQTRDESHASPPAPDVSMYGDAANVKSTFNANQESGDAFLPMPVQTSKQERSKLVETAKIGDSEMDEKSNEEMDVKTPAIGSAEGDTVGGDENADKIPDQLPVTKYGEASEIYEGVEATGENRAQKWHEQAKKEGEALGIKEEENRNDTDENAAEDDVGEENNTEAIAEDTKKRAEEDEETARKRAKEEAAAAAKKAEEKAARKEARKAAKRAKRAAERAAAKKAEQEVTDATMKATTDQLSNDPPLPDSAKTGLCQGCIIC